MPGRRWLVSTGHATRSTGCSKVPPWVTLQGGMGHGRKDLTGLDHFAEGLTVGIFTDEAWVENVPRVTR